MKIDVARLLGAVTREISTREVNGKPARALVASRVYDTSVEDLWDTLTNPERIPRWFPPISGELRLGGRYQLEGNAQGQIEACEPPQHLAVTWEFGGDTSWVKVWLEGQGEEQSLLRLEHLAHVPDDFWDQYGPGATGVGWEQALLGLELHLAGDGIAIVPAEFEAWLKTPNGASFIADCSQAWGRASIASGTDPAAAQAAVQQTTAFYSG